MIPASVSVRIPSTVKPRTSQTCTLRLVLQAKDFELVLLPKDKRPSGRTSTLLTHTLLPTSSAQDFPYPSAQGLLLIHSPGLSTKTV